MASWPTSVKSFSPVVNGVTKLVAALYNAAYDEIEAIETNLSGSVVQVVNYQRSDTVTCATAIPADNNSRTSSEGNLVLTRTITPKSNSNVLRIDFVINVKRGSSETVCAILMDGTTVLATFRTCIYSYDGLLCGTYWVTSPGTSEKTYNINVGGVDDIVVNTNTMDNGKLTSSITITEIRA
jgi:hypothetical protein